MNKVFITTDFIKLQQAMKLADLVGSGSDVKFLLEEGLIKVNGETATQRGKKLYPGDVVTFEGESFTVAREEE